MMDFNLKLSVEAYPDGEIVLFLPDDESHTLSKKQVLDSIKKNLRVCEWLGKNDLREFISDLQEIVDENR